MQSHTFGSAEPVAGSTFYPVNEGAKKKKKEKKKRLWCNFRTLHLEPLASILYYTNIYSSIPILRTLMLNLESHAKRSRMTVMQTEC
jgi:hypothetical protein